MRFLSIFNNLFKKSINNVTIVPTTHDSVTNNVKIVPANIISNSAISIIEAHEVENINTQIGETLVASPLLISSEVTSIQIENNNEENNNQANNNQENPVNDFYVNISIMIGILIWLFAS